MCNGLFIEIPGTCQCITPGCKIKLGRFNKTVWIVFHGWYSYGGNRAVCGWYMQNKDDLTQLKPLTKTDLDDIYLIEK